MNPLHRIVRAAAVCVLSLACMGQIRMRVVAPVQSDLAALPLLSDGDRTFAQVATFIGGFRTPASGSNGYLTEDFPKVSIAYDPTNDSMYATGRNKVDGVQVPGVAHLDVPALVLASSTGTMNYATLLAYEDPTEGRRSEADPGATSEYAAAFALAIQGGRLIGSLNIAYDATNSQPKSFYSRPKSLTTTGNVLGLTRFWDGTKNDVSQSFYEHYLAGVLAPVPTLYQAALGGDLLAGSAHTSIVTIQSYGPSIFAINSANIGGTGTQAAVPLAFYPSTHQTLGAYLANGTYYGHAWSYTGMAVIDGTRSVLISGRRGSTWCYGTGTGTEALHGTDDGTGSVYCYDPTQGGKGNHGYPYEYFLLEYDVLDLLRVKAGIDQPWAVLPSNIWDFDFPIVPGATVAYEVAGLSYDPATRYLWIAQRAVNQSGCCVFGAVIWAMQLDITP